MYGTAPALEVGRARQTKTLDFRVYSDNPFRGKVGPAIDAAWDKLFTSEFRYTKFVA